GDHWSIPAGTAQPAPDQTTPGRHPSRPQYVPWSESRKIRLARPLIAGLLAAGAAHHACVPIPATHKWAHPHYTVDRYGRLRRRAQPLRETPESPSTSVGHLHCHPEIEILLRGLRQSRDPTENRSDPYALLPPIPGWFD